MRFISENYKAFCNISQSPRSNDLPRSLLKRPNVGRRQFLCCTLRKLFYFSDIYSDHVLIFRIPKPTFQFRPNFWM